MSTESGHQEQILSPLRSSSGKFWALFAVLAVGTLGFLAVWANQILNGLIITGLGDWGTGAGVPWGLYIGTFVWWIGIAHGGIAVSAAVRVFKLETFAPIARIAEVLTIIALPMAALNIVFDLGRPDRLIVPFIQWPFTVHHSPLAWDIAVVSLYLVLSVTYLVFSLRTEIAEFRDSLPGALSPLYSLILLGYSPQEEQKAESIRWWLAGAILILVALLSGGVVPWLFSLTGSMPGWFGAGTGPAMLIESLTSAIAMVIIVGAIFRYGFDWDSVLPEEIFEGLSLALMGFSLAVLYFLVHDVLTGIYMGPVNIEALTQAMISMPLFLIAVAVLAIAFLYLFLQGIGVIGFNLGATTAVAIGVTLAILAKKVIFVVEGLMYPSSPPLSNLYPTGSYMPTMPEFALAGGTIIVAGFLFMVFIKVIPMVELEIEEVRHDDT